MELSSNFLDNFFADAQQGTNSTFYGFSLGLITNIDAFKSAWNGSENFRFVLVGYINIFIILLVFAFVFLKNLNQYMGEKRKNRIAKKKLPPKVEQTLAYKHCDIKG